MTKLLTKLAYRIWNWIMEIDPVIEKRLEYYCNRDKPNGGLNE